MRKTPLLLLPALVGCAGNDFHGVYVGFIDDLVLDEPVDRVFDFNYTDAQRPPVDTTPVEWTEEFIQDLSEQAMFIEVFDVADVEGDFTRTMVVNGDVLLGTEQDDGTWTFAWTYSEHLVDSQSHTSGYSYVETSDIQAVWTVNLTLDDVAVGDVHIGQTQDIAWDESDLWDAAEIGSNFGESPSNSFLEHISDETPVTNLGDSTDCSATICHLGISGAEGMGGSITLRPTDLNADEFEAVYGSGQDAGLPDL